MTHRFLDFSLAASSSTDDDTDKTADALSAPLAEDDKYTEPQNALGKKRKDVPDTQSMTNETSKFKSTTNVIPPRAVRR